MKTYQEKFGEVPNQFAADAYDCVYAYYQALTNAKATPDMDAETLCDLDEEGIHLHDLRWSDRRSGDLG